MKYAYLGNWEDNPANSNVEEVYLKAYLKKCGYNDTLIRKAIYELKHAANNPIDDLYKNNKNVYKLLRFGVSVKEDAGQNFQTVQLINWKNVEANDFGIAEEVTVFGQKERRPDLVLYVNEIALGIIELKRGIKDVTLGIRQNLSSQKIEFILPFFNTIQLVMTGNDSQGLRLHIITKFYMRGHAQKNYILATYTRKFSKIIDYDSIKYRGINDTLVAVAGSSAFGNFIASKYNSSSLSGSLLSSSIFSFKTNHGFK
ncbi:MAG: hypothetical protein H7296_08030 [Bacteroidia bacterium]|nr:hypothetical protein [Bacteroidia bacterium]